MEFFLRSSHRCPRRGRVSEKGAAAGTAAATREAATSEVSRICFLSLSKDQVSGWRAAPELILRQAQDDRDVLRKGRDDRDVLRKGRDDRDVLRKGRDDRDVLRKGRDDRDVLRKGRAKHFAFREVPLPVTCPASGVGRSRRSSSSRRWRYERRGGMLAAFADS
jgi:hypothetical protein